VLQVVDEGLGVKSHVVQNYRGQSFNSTTVTPPPP
jgi:hypothetical protein